MGAKSRRKGAKGELEVSRIVAAWWMQDATLLEAMAADLPIRRTPLSGGWTRGKDFRGDLVPVTHEAEPFSMWSVEVKNQEKWSFDTILKPDITAWPLDQWWEQCRRDAKEAHAWPLLAFTRNRHPWYLRIRGSHYRLLCASAGAKLDIATTMRVKGCIFTLLNDFVRTFTPDHCLEAFTCKKR